MGNVLILAEGDDDGVCAGEAVPHEDLVLDATLEDSHSLVLGNRREQALQFGVGSDIHAKLIFSCRGLEQVPQYQLSGVSCST